MKGDDNEPPRKRARAGSKSGRASDSGNDSESDVDAVVVGGSLPATNALELRFIRGNPDASALSAARSYIPELTTHPWFVNQIYPESVIHGYRSATVAIYFTCSSLTCWIDLDISYYYLCEC